MQLQIKKRFNALKVAFLAMLVTAMSLPGFAMADDPVFALPTATVLGYIAVAIAFVSAIGAGVLGLIYIAKAFHWGKKAG